MDDRGMTPTERVIAAWTAPGKNPLYHNFARVKLDRDWPVLARALDALVAANDNAHRSEDA